MKRGLVKVFTVTAAMVSMLSMSMTVCAAESYTVAQGDHLMKIAQDKYGDESKWNVIFEANKETIKEPTKIYPGQVIVIPDLAAEVLQAPAAPAVQPEAVPAVPAVQPEAVPMAPAAQPEAAPAVQPETAPAAPAGMTLEDYGKDPEFKTLLDSEMQMFTGSGMGVDVLFQGNTMAVIVTITDSAYLVDGIGDALNEAMETVRPMVEEMVVMIENELGNPGNCVVIYSYQTADGKTLAQKSFTAKK